MSDSVPFAMQAGHFFLKTTFLVVEIFAGRFAAIFLSLHPEVTSYYGHSDHPSELSENRPVTVPQIEAGGIYEFFGKMSSKSLFYFSRSLLSDHTGSPVQLACS